MSYDIKCQVLAQDFLYDHPDKFSDENVKKLAQAIQTEIENVIEDLPSEETP